MRKPFLEARVLLPRTLSRGDHLSRRRLADQSLYPCILSSRLDDPMGRCRHNSGMMHRRDFRVYLSVSLCTKGVA